MPRCHPSRLTARTGAAVLLALLATAAAPSARGAPSASEGEVSGETASPPGATHDTSKDWYRLVRITNEDGEPLAHLRQMIDPTTATDGEVMGMPGAGLVTVRVGDRFRDGHVHSIDVAEQTLTIRQLIDDPRLLKPYQDRVFRPFPRPDRAAPGPPPLHVGWSPLPKQRARVSGWTSPSARVVLRRAAGPDDDVKAVAVGEDGRFRAIVPRDGGSVIVEASDEEGRRSRREISPADLDGAGTATARKRER